MFWLSTTVVLTAGTLFVMWLGEKITDKGIGNGTSIIIMTGILARLPESLLQEFTRARNWADEDPARRWAENSPDFGAVLGRCQGVPVWRASACSAPPISPLSA